MVGRSLTAVSWNYRSPPCDAPWKLAISPMNASGFSITFSSTCVPRSTHEISKRPRTSSGKVGFGPIWLVISSLPHQRKPPGSLEILRSCLISLGIQVGSRSIGPKTMLLFVWRQEPHRRWAIGRKLISTVPCSVVSRRSHRKRNRMPRRRNESQRRRAVRNHR